VEPPQFVFCLCYGVVETPSKRLSGFILRIIGIFRYDFLQIVVPPQILFFYVLVVKELPFNLAFFLRKIAIFGYDFDKLWSLPNFFCSCYGGREAALYTKELCARKSRSKLVLYTHTVCQRQRYCHKSQVWFPSPQQFSFTYYYNITTC